MYNSQPGELYLNSKKSFMKFKINKAIEFLLARGNLPILYWLKKDILLVPVDREKKNLKKYAERIRILESQQPAGNWGKKKPGVDSRWEKTHFIVETLRNILRLHTYGCTYEDEGIRKAVDYLYSTQSEEGDFRGAYLNEFAPTYHSLTLEVLCLLGLDKDPRTQKGFKWLMDNRQEDGGWAIPYRTVDKETLKDRYSNKNPHQFEPIQPDKTKPSSHLVTGMALRALSLSSKWKDSPEARQAGELLAGRFFKKDVYEDRQEAFYWDEIIYPFWATDILSSLDSLSRIGFSTEDRRIQAGLKWLQKKQTIQGYWQAGHKKSTLEDHLWVTFAVLRVLKSFNIFET